MSRRALWPVTALCSTLVATGERAAAQGEAGAPPPVATAPADPAGPPPMPPRGTQVPDEFRAIDVEEVAYGLRDDYWSSVMVGKDGTIYVSTYEGRAYVSRDDAQTWTEGTIIPEVKSFFTGFAFGVYLGRVRKAGPLPGHTIGLGGEVDGMNLLLRRGSVRSSRPEDAKYPGNLGLTGLFPAELYRFDLADEVRGEARDASGSAEGVLGVGLSSRAPRLSILLDVRGRTVPNISLDRLLITSTRGNQVRRIVPHPDNPQHLFAASRSGLFESQDGGISWMRTYAGAVAPERPTYMVAFDPRDHKRAYLGTARGMYQSENGGMSWSKNTAVPEFEIKNVVIDPTDSNIVYVAGQGGVFRSTDRARTFSLAYYSTQRRLNDVQWMVLDPFDPERAYVGTSEGLFVTDRARKSRISDFRMLAPARTLGLNMQILGVCSRHRGHIYAAAKDDLPSINYGNADNVDVMVIESWDGGETWRQLITNRTRGDLQWFTVDPRDPDTIWVAFSRALMRVRRAGDAPVAGDDPVDLAIYGPTMTQVLDGALSHHGLDLASYQRTLDRLRWRSWVPTVVATFGAGARRVGGDLDDNQFAADRLLRYEHRSMWQLMVWATWRLPAVIYDHEAVAMQKLSRQMMNDEVREKIITTVHKNYGELQRLRVRTRTAGDDRPLYVRAIERVRMEQLEAVVDLASGGYLSKRARADARKEQQP